MTAGSGLIHSEVSSEEFLKKGGEEEIIQLWLNLPSGYKMIPPKYVGKTKDEITHISEDNGKVIIHLISGFWADKEGPVDPLTRITMTYIEMKSGGEFSARVEENSQILFYVVKGEVVVNGQQAKIHELVEFEMDHEELEVKASEDSMLIFGYGEPFNEPIVAQGPFVMNSQEEIRQAFHDYQTGKMGSWEE